MTQKTKKQNQLENKRKQLVHFALKQLGKPYKYAAKKTEIGKMFDCSSLTQYLYKKIGVDIPRSTILQAECGKIIPSHKKPSFFKPTDLQIGDLLFFKGSKGHYNKKFPNGIGHVIMYLGNKKFIHASGQGSKKNQKVKLEKFEKIVNRKDFQIAKRILF